MTCPCADLLSNDKRAWRARSACLTQVDLDPQCGALQGLRQATRAQLLDLRCRARAGLEPAKPARDAARALGNCIARNQDPDSFVIGQFYGSARALIGSLSVTVAVNR